MIKEIVHRKYSSHNIFDGDDKISNKNNNINSITNNKIENSFPSLIVIDGGKGQLSAAQIVLKKMSLNIPLISIAKENEDIYTNFSSEPMQISKKNPALHLLQFVRDEAHRFGLAYNTKLRAINLK
jgi:excinuclease ABC subunit C